MSHARSRYAQRPFAKRPAARLTTAIATLLASSIVTHTTAHAGPVQHIATVRHIQNPVNLPEIKTGEAQHLVSRPVGTAETRRPTPQISCSPQDFELLARLVHAEAANQPFAGQVAVAAVVLNRLKSPGFPKTIPAIIEQPGQFDSYNSERFWTAPNASAYSAVQAALRGADPVRGALYYYNPQMPYAAWMNTLPVTATIGNQIFCQ